MIAIDAVLARAEADLDQARRRLEVAQQIAADRD
jgi:hypothetical protein